MFPLLRYKKIDEQFADHQFPYQVCDLSLVGFLHLLHLLPPFLLFSIIEIKFHVSFFLLLLLRESQTKKLMIQ